MFNFLSRDCFVLNRIEEAYIFVRIIEFILLFNLILGFL